MGLISFLIGSAEAAVTLVKGPDPNDATDATTASNAALKRLARMNNGESIAVSLAGGGAWGFGHIGLIEHLADQGIPTDFVSGVSSGSIVAALHAWKTTAQGTGATGMQELRKRHRQALPVTMTCVVTMSGLERWITSVTGGTTDTQTESACLSFHTRVFTGEPATTGGTTLGEGTAAASSMPPLFAPKDYQGDPVIDGGFSYNLPTLTQMRAASGTMPYFIASNPIPKQLGGPAKTLGQSFLTKRGILRRIRDVSYGVFHLLRTSSDLQASHAELLFAPDLHCWTPIDFSKMVELADRGYVEAKSRLSGPNDPQWSYQWWIIGNNSASAQYLTPSSVPPPTVPLVTTPCP
ncbi:MAG: hypothetical protein GY898_03260 [Proteobacteria bacterium]|nr:hypothetical protein [Pseudomonadota bacterium]